MRNFFAGLLILLVAIVSVPFLTGLILYFGSFEYYLAIVSASLMLVGFFLLFRGRWFRHGLVLILLSTVAILSSKEIIHFEGFNPISGTYYLGGIEIPIWGLILCMAIVILIVRTS